MSNYANEDENGEKEEEGEEEEEAGERGVSFKNIVAPALDSRKKKQLLQVASRYVNCVHCRPTSRDCATTKQLLLLFFLC